MSGPDKLAEVFKAHRLSYVLSTCGDSEVCRCGHEGDHDLHLANIVRGYRRTRPVKWAGPSSDSRVRKSQHTNH